jgi:hypothetical protein
MTESHTTGGIIITVILSWDSIIVHFICH